MDVNTHTYTHTHKITLIILIIKNVNYNNVLEDYNACFNKGKNKESIALVQNGENLPDIQMISET